MVLFTSPREKHIWLCAFAVFTAIFLTLFIRQPLTRSLNDQNIQAVIFLLGMILAGGAVVAHGLKAKPSKIEITILLGIMSVYTMLFLRLGIPERSHLIEYSVLAIFIHKALIERASQRNIILMPALFSFLIALLIGVFDECIQIFLPNRVFDPLDILFNSMAVIMAIGSSMLIIWVRKRTRVSSKR